MSYDKWFRGDNSLFGGIEYHIPYANGLKFKIEMDPFDYYDFACCGGGISEDFKITRDKDSKINFGFSFPLNKNINLNLSYIKGNLINLSWSIGADFSESIVKKEKFSPKIKKNNNNNISFYEALLLNLNNNELYLQTAELESETLKVAISTSKYRSSMRAASYVTEITNITNYEYKFTY